jgi:hypothetical protein
MVVPGVDVLIAAGLHVPEIPSFEVVGSEGAVASWQSKFDIAGKVGTTPPATDMFTETGPAQEPADGVNV